MIDFEDLIFQAQCEIDTLANNFEDGGTLQHCADDVLTMHLFDGSKSTIHLAPVQALLTALRAIR